MTDPVATRIARDVQRRVPREPPHVDARRCGRTAVRTRGRRRRPAQIVFTHDYPASALHEAAHWCLAGPLRRTQRDYGYWYVPGPRNPVQREAFFRAEADVQALEAIFARTCGVRFVVSADDFDASPEELERFEARRRDDGWRLDAPRCRRARARFCDALTAAFAIAARSRSWLNESTAS